MARVVPPLARALGGLGLLTLLVAPTIAGGLLDPREWHLTNLRRLTTGGQNAEAYFSADGTRLVFQSTRPPFECDQIFEMAADGSGVRLLSTGLGRTTCGFYFPEGRRFVYASTHAADAACPPRPDRSKGYVWPVHAGYDIHAARTDGTGLVRLTDTPGYDAECAVSPDGHTIVFCSQRSGDLDLWVMDAAGGGARRLTYDRGYEGGPFFSWDGQWIVYRSTRPRSVGEIFEYRRLLAQGLVRPSHAEIMLMRPDGTGRRQLTENGAANWAPFLHPDNRTVVFCSNLHDPRRKTFSLYSVHTDGTGLARVSFGARFDGFPMFSADGRRIVFSSTRGTRGPHEYDIFMADWRP